MHLYIRGSAYDGISFWTIDNEVGVGIALLDGALVEIRVAVFCAPSSSVDLNSLSPPTSTPVPRPSRSFSLIMGDVILRDFDGNTLSSMYRMGLDFDVILLTPSTFPRLLAVWPH